MIQDDRPAPRFLLCPTVRGQAESPQLRLGARPDRHPLSRDTRLFRSQQEKLQNNRIREAVAPSSLGSPSRLPLPRALGSDLTSPEAEGDENSLFGRSCVWGGGGRACAPAAARLPSSLGGSHPLHTSLPPGTLEILQAQLTSVPPWPSSVPL